MSELRFALLVPLIVLLLCALAGCAGGVPAVAEPLGVFDWLTLVLIVGSVLYSFGSIGLAIGRRVTLSRRRAAARKSADLSVAASRENSNSQGLLRRNAAQRPAPESHTALPAVAQDEGATS